MIFLKKVKIRQEVKVLYEDPLNYLFNVDMDVEKLPKTVEKT